MGWEPDFQAIEFSKSDRTLEWVFGLVFRWAE